ncbi:MAG: hypothetical protein HXL57_01570 [Solobacterium sp.]|jgi:hypothetical protein|nr:hypothetical protein [Solobacterium sp.]
MTQLDKDLNTFLEETFGNNHNVVIHGAHGYTSYGYTWLYDTKVSNHDVTKALSIVRLDAKPNVYEATAFVVGEHVTENEYLLDFEELKEWVLAHKDFLNS